MSGYFVAPDAYGDECLWRHTDNPDKPEEVAMRAAYDAADPALWPVLVGVLTDDDDTALAVAKAIRDEYEDGHELTEPYEWLPEARAALKALRGGEQ